MDDFNEFERKAWERKASRYQDTWGKVTAQATDAVLKATLLKAGERLLDIGCGPGHFCQAAHLKGAKVIGADHSQKMIEIARANYPELTFSSEDAENLSFADKSFDIVTLNYLLLHVADQKRALNEAGRVLEPGGRLVYTMWLPPDNSPGFNLIFSALKQYADMSVIPPAQDIFLFSDGDYAKQFLMGTGFTDIHAEKFESYWQFSDGESLFSALQSGTRIGGMIELQTPAVKNKIRDAVILAIEEFKASDGYYIPTPSLIVSAYKLM